MNPKKEFEELQRTRLLAAIREHGGNIAAVARAMDYDRTHVHKLIDKYGLKREVARARLNAVESANP